MSEVVIAAALRTPHSAPAVPQTPGAALLRALIERAAIAADAVDELLFGVVSDAAAASALARRAALSAGLAPALPAMTLGPNAVAGLDAVALARNIILAGDARLIIAAAQASAAAAAPGATEDDADEEIVPFAVDASAAERAGDVTDGAAARDDTATRTEGAALLLCSTACAAELKLPVLARTVACARVGIVDGTDAREARAGDGTTSGAATDAAIGAARACLARAGWRPETLDLVATGAPRGAEALGLDPARSRLATGDPHGAAGAFALVRLVHALRRQDLGRGLVALAGDGRGVAVAVEHDTSDSLADVIAPDFGQGEDAAGGADADAPAAVGSGAAGAVRG